MRLTKEQATANRQLVLDTAGRLFRERGFDGIGVADLMREAGFTHGGFYNHFASKSELEALVSQEIMAKAAAKLAAKAQDPSRKRKDIFAEYVAGYLSTENRDQPGQACALPSLCADIARQGSEVKQAFGAGLESYLASLLLVMPARRDAKGKKRPASRADAIAAMAALVGGMVLARAIAGTDEAASSEILAAVQEHVLGDSPNK
ncbi:MAG TPA: TetR/AcrR family transcriptional regulator [Beijerinckia sp.]|nr:TetR/AcrR family transcriptional regulator [Beijerinckia sp.]